MSESSVPEIPYPYPEGVSWTAPGRVEDQPDNSGMKVKAIHMHQNKTGLWYTVLESSEGTLHRLESHIADPLHMIKELRHAGRVHPGVTVYIDPPYYKTDPYGFKDHGEQRHPVNPKRARIAE